MDSIALTYSLLDPIMTVLRPVAAFITALVAGLLENFMGPPAGPGGISDHSQQTIASSCHDLSPEDGRSPKIINKLSEAARFVTNDLMNDFAGWFVLGVVLAAIITVMLPESLLQGALGGGITAYLAVLLGSLPLYVCASMSTPIAAALVLKGMSPGAALVLLMAGPATNVATITMVGGMLGKRTLAIYLSSIVLCTIGFAFLTDAVYQGLGISAHAAVGATGRALVPEWIQLISSAILGLLIGRALVARAVRGRPAEVQESRQPYATEPCATGCDCGAAEVGDT
jgi:uncharacterized membrane protein YraQ (UPF0718 family)